MKNTLLFVIVLLIGSEAYSQLSYLKRVEFELKDGYSDERIEPFGENGVIITSEKDGSTKNIKSWRYDLYDSDFELITSKEVDVSDRFYQDERHINEERMHTLYKDRKGNFSIVTAEASDLSITEVQGELPKKANVSDMAVLGDYAFFSASIKDAPFLFSVNWKTGAKKLIPIVIPNVKPKKTWLKEFQVLKGTNEIFMYVTAQIDKETNNVYVIRLNNAGEREDIFNLSKKVKKNIISITGSKVGEGNYIFTGTYSTESLSTSEGLFFCETQKGVVQFIKYYDFLSLDKFLSYLPEKRIEKIEKKKAKKEKKGKDFTLNYRIAAHEIIILDDGYLFLGEAYYPTYRTETFTTTSTNANGVTTTTTHTIRVFDGYQYTHAMMGKFNKEGELMWDEIFEMFSAYKPFYVKRFISISEKTDNSLKLVFSSDKRVFTKEIGFDGKVYADEGSEEIETTQAGDEFKRSFSNIDFWYDNYFIAYGIQVIKNKDEEKGAKKKRKVFFVSKIKFN
jgi:hypothetical protein